MANLEIAIIRMDGGTQPRELIDIDIVEEYSLAMVNGATFPPVTVYFDGKEYWLADGFHRIGAAFQANYDSIECEVKQGTQRDAKLFSVGANAVHGLRRKNSDKRRAVLTLLEDTEWKRLSDREIARRCVVDNSFVSKLRKDVSVDYPQIEREVIRNGKPFSMSTAGINDSRREPTRQPYCSDCLTFHAVGLHTKLVMPREVIKPQQRPPSSRSYITLTEWGQMSEDEKSSAINRGRSDTFKFNQTNENVEWAMWTWNPITGCYHNCTYCYARDIAMRFYEQEFEPTFLPERLDGPKNTKVPEKAKVELGYGNVFTCSMADLFGKWVPQEWIDAVLQVMREQAQWNYLVLTKFPQRLSEQDWPQNTWVGASIDRQARVKETMKCFDRVKRKSNASITWLSLEPLLEPLKFDSLDMFDMVVIGGASASTQTPEWIPPSGWIADIMMQADKAGAAVYLKTNGRPREYPGHKPASSIIAPAAFGLIQLSK